MPARYRVLVLSDLHAIDDLSRARATPAMNYAMGSAPRGLLTMSRDAVLGQFPDGIDLVLCAGDMTDRASGGPLAAVWADLHWFASQFGAPLVATSGNHDYDSRNSDGPLPHKSLIRLDPPFPFGTATDRDRYFARQHAVYADSKAVVVSANSAAHHGYAADKSPEHEFGRFDDDLPSLITESLTEISPLPRVRILLTHHHLNQLPDFDTNERAASIGHEAVLRRLSEHGDWLVIHGHKHRGWLQYASGTGDSPPLLSASSFSADLGGGTFEEKVRHQFHVIEFDLDPSTTIEGMTGAYGTVTTWTHSPLGWNLAESEQDMPGVSGFGWKVSIAQLADRLRAAVAIGKKVGAVELDVLEPKLRFLTFDDMRRLTRQLEAGSPRIASVIAPDGRLIELSVSEAQVA